MAGGRRTTWLRWVLCGLSLAFMLFGAALRIAFPESAGASGFYALVDLLEFILVPLVGALIAVRMPANPYGWLWCALALVYGVLAVCDGLRRTDAVPSWLTGTVGGAAYTVAVCLIVFVLLLSPTGRLPSRSWRWPARGAVLAAGTGIVVLPFAPSVTEGADSTPWAVAGRAGAFLSDVVNAAITAIFLSAVLAAGSVLVRFRRAGPVERQQLKWFLLAAALLASSISLDLLPVTTSGPLWAVLDGIAFTLLPVAVGIAVLRYRLYEIDRIVSRTVSYGLLTAGLISLYLLVVAFLRPFLEPLTGSSSLVAPGRVGVWIRDPGAVR